MSRALLLCLASLAAQFSAHAEWPRIVSQTDRFHIVSPIRKSPVDVPIRDIDGKAVYRLVCGSFDTPIGDFAYSGDFECRLSLLRESNSYSTLLTEDTHQSRDWESRGRFFAADLKGACARIPQFGATRSFELRGMDLTLGVTDQKFTAGGKLTSLTLTVTVRPDPRAQRSIAEIVPLPTAGVPAHCELQKFFVNPGELSKDH